MLIKISGAFLIIISSYGFGFILNKRNRCRIEELRNFSACLNVFSNEVCYSFNNIVASFEKASQYASNFNKKFFDYIIKNYNTVDASPISYIWINAIDETPNFNILYNKEDINIIKSFGNLLGAGDTKLQEDNIEALSKILDERIDKLEKQNSKYSMYTKISIYAGILIVIILI